MRARLLAADSVMAPVQRIIHTVAAMHGQDFVHGDIKPANILLRNLFHPSSSIPVGEEAILADFGTAGFIDSNTGGLISRGFTSQLAAPEVMSNPDPTNPNIAMPGLIYPQSDVFSCGVLAILAARDSLPAICLQNATLSSVVYSMIRPDPNLRMRSASLEHFLSQANVGQISSTRLTDADILLLLARHNDLNDPCRKEYKIWRDMVRFVDERSKLACDILRPDFVDALDADHAVITFQKVGWLLTDLTGFLYSLAESSIGRNAYADLVGLEEKLIEACYRVASL